MFKAKATTFMALVDDATLVELHQFEEVRKDSYTDRGDHDDDAKEICSSDKERTSNLKYFEVTVITLL